MTNLERINTLQLIRNNTEFYFHKDASEAFKEALDMGIKALEQTQWIPCSERLPVIPKENPDFEMKPLDIYLVCKKGGIPFRAFWNGKQFADGWTTLDVDAWMPLPEPYKP